MGAREKGLIVQNCHHAFDKKNSYSLKSYFFYVTNLYIRAIILNGYLIGCKDNHINLEIEVKCKNFFKTHRKFWLFGNF